MMIEACSHDITASSCSYIRGNTDVLSPSHGTGDTADFVPLPRKYCGYCGPCSYCPHYRAAL